MSFEGNLGKKNVKELLNGYKLIIPPYQRVYSWEEKQYEQFWLDIKDFSEQKSSRYFIGHILLEKENEKYSIVDGQQRITTMVIILNILQKLLDGKDVDLNNFSTGENEQDAFQNDIIEADLSRKKDPDEAETASMRRCLQAHQYFVKKIESKEVEPETVYTMLLETECTIQIMENKMDTVRRFIFENDRGKPVNNFEKFKTLCMYELYLQGKEDQIEKLTRRITKIYQILERIHYHYDEESLLRDTARIYFNNLGYDKSANDLKNDLKKDDIVKNIEKFSNLLVQSVEAYERCIKDGTENKNKDLSHTIRALHYLGITDLFRPFIIRDYLNSTLDDQKVKLFRNLEHLLFRHKLISTRAELLTRINWMFEHDGIDIARAIKDHLFINNDDWWKHWNDENYKRAVKDEFIKNAYHRRSVTRYVLYKYEYHLWKTETKQALPDLSFCDMKTPSLEHIAPQKPPAGKEYDEKFKQNCLQALGNLILIPQSSNSSVSNKPIKEKLKEYKNELIVLRHVKDICDKVEQGTWGKDDIEERTKKLENFMLETLRSDIG